MTADTIGANSIIQGLSLYECSTCSMFTPFPINPYRNKYIPYTLYSSSGTVEQNRGEQRYKLDYRLFSCF